MPDFNQEQFLEMCHSELVPRVLNAYLKGDMEVLRAACRDQAYAQLNALIQERTARQVGRRLTRVQHARALAL